MPRTTVRLDDDLFRKTRAFAAETGRTLTAVIEDALREVLARQHARRERAPVALPTFRGQGLQPGVDLDDSAGLLDIMNDRNAPA